MQASPTTAAKQSIDAMSRLDARRRLYTCIQYSQKSAHTTSQNLKVRSLLYTSLMGMQVPTCGELSASATRGGAGVQGSSGEALGVRSHLDSAAVT